MDANPQTSFAETAPVQAAQADRIAGRTGNIFDRTICLSVELRRLGTRKKVKNVVNKNDIGADQAQVTVDGNPEAIHVSKELLDSERYKEIAAMDNEIRAYIARYCLPSLFRSGVYLLPIASLERVDRRLQALKQDREDLVARFCDEYPARVEAARARLGGLYDDRDYPKVENVRGAFGMETRYITFNTPTSLREINADIWEREQKKAAAAMQSATEQLTQMMRANMADLVAHMVDRLSPTEDGKTRIFKNTLVGNIKDFLDTFQSKNITDDRELAALVDKAKKALDGVTPEGLRDVDTLREKTRETFAGLKTELDSMLIDKPGRRINFDA